MSPQDITEFLQFLKGQQKMIQLGVSNALTKQIVDMVFEILRASLNMRLEEESNEMAKAYGEDK